MKYFVIGVVMLAILAGSIYFLSRQPSPEATDGMRQPVDSEEQLPPFFVGNELKIVDLKIGTGAEARSGTTATVHYVGTFSNGVKFDSSYDRGKPFLFTLGQGMVIAGWERGIQGMRVGGKRRLMIPASLAYGSVGSSDGGIPPNTPLIFEVELFAIQ